MAARTVPTVPQFLAGQKLTATLLNQLGSVQTFWADPPMFRMRQTIAQSIPNATQTVVTMDTPEYDTDSGRSGSTPWTYTIPVGMGGRWWFAVHVPLSAATANERDVFVYRNGSPVVGGQETTNVSTLNSQMTIMTTTVNAGDVMAAAVFQQSGAADSTFIGTNVMPTFEGRLVSLANP